VTPQEHANTVREALKWVDDVYGPPKDDALAALDALLAQAETAANRESDARHWMSQLEAAEAERDHARDALREISEARTLADALIIARAALSAREEAWTHEDRMVLGEGGC
jgi:hypothetical protein